MASQEQNHEQNTEENAHHGTVEYYISQGWVWNEELHALVRPESEQRLVERARQKRESVQAWLNKLESSSNEESSSDEGMEGSASPKNPFISEEVEDEDVEYEGDDEDEDEDEVREEEVEEDEDEDDDDDEENLPSEHEGEEVSSSGDPSSNDDFFGPEGESTLHDILALLHVAETGPGDL